MRQITFTFKNIEKVEKFLNGKLYSYFNIGTPSAKFILDDDSKKEIELRDGEVLFKDRKNNVFKKIN